MAADEKYVDGLSKEAKERYFRKLQCLYGGPGVSLARVRCPYKIPNEQWIDDVCKWPPVEFGHLYVYFIETPGGYTCEKMKAYKSLEAYNYYYRFGLFHFLYDALMPHLFQWLGSYCVLS